MAHSKSAKKSILITAKNRTHNRAITSAVKTQIAKAEGLIQSKELNKAGEAVKRAAISLDKAKQKGIIHVNNAARRKSRLIKKLKIASETKS